MSGAPQNSGGPTLDPKTFIRRLAHLYTHWQNPARKERLWKSADALVIAMGLPDDENPYHKTNAVQNWFLGYEFSDTVIVFTLQGVYILSSPRKAQLLESVKTALAQEGSKDGLTHSNLQLLIVDKSTGNKANFQTIFHAIAESDSKQRVLGSLTKDKVLGPFGDQWNDALTKESHDYKLPTIVDVSFGWSDLLAVKDAQEIKMIRNSANISTQVMSKNLISKIVTVVDEGRSITHNQLSEEIDDLFSNPEKINSRLPHNSVDSSYTPIIQSGGVYDLRLSAANTNDPLHFGTIVCSLGARYKGYCSSIARTLFIDPKDEVVNNYKILLEIHNAVFKALKVGNKMNVPMNKALEILQKHPELEGKFTKSCGYGIGLEFQEGYLLLNTKNELMIKSGMIFSIVIGFQGLELKKPDSNSKNNTYALLLSDTVLIGEDGNPENLTAKCEKKFSVVSYFLDKEPEVQQNGNGKGKSKAKEEAKEKSVKNEKFRDEESVPSVVVNSRTRGEVVNNNNASNDNDDRKYRQEMEARHLEEAEKRLARSKGKGDDGGGESSGVFGDSRFTAYKDPSELPTEASKNQIHIDAQKEVIILPIYGYSVPFHISTIKNASKNEDYLRINFLTPSLTQASSSSSEKVYIREVTYRIQNAKNLNNNLRMIKELRKRVTQRESEAKEKQNLVIQEKLIMSKARNPRLADVFIRPTLAVGAGGRRANGTLEAHVNGFKFTTSKGQSIDILYKNIKHSFFQPAEGELVVLIHFHLYHGIMIGKKKSDDVQFCAEVMEGSLGLDGRGSMMDRDEIEEEQREADHRKKLNEEFRQFVKKVEDLDGFQAGPKEFDIPYRDLGFYGVPVRSNVFLQPTVNCLVSLVEAPFFVLTLEEVEVVHLERVQFNLKNFDMVFVFKDHSKAVVHVNSIPMETLDEIKDWLKESKMLFYEGPSNLNWNRIMHTVKEDEEGFIRLGGWGFLSNDADSDEGAEDDSEDGSNFEGDSSDSEPEEEYDESEYSEEEDEEEEEEEEEESEEEGLSWDELEARAKKEDKERGTYSDDERPANKSKSKRSREYSDDEDSDDQRKKTKTVPKKQAPPPKKMGR